MGRCFELLCIVLLALGQMCIMTGYDTQSFVQESVIHSVHGREPDRISEFAGYYGAAVVYAAYLTTSLFAPWIGSLIGPKLTCLCGSIGFTTYMVGFLFLHKYFYFFSCACMGAGFALFYAGHGAYLTSHSTRKTVESNSAISWGIACGCMVFGGLILALVFSVHHEPHVVAANVTETADIHRYRIFSSTETLYIYGALAAVTALANVIFLVMPSKEIENCIEGRNDKKKRSFLMEMKAMKDAIMDRRMILLTSTFVHLGLWTSFWVSVYPTTFTFTHTLSTKIYLPAIYSIFVGVGEILMGFFISHMSQRVKDFGLKPTMFLGFGTTTATLVIMFVSTSPWATVRPTNGAALLIEPNMVLCAVTALLIGLADSCINTVRTVVCAVALPDSRAQAFSISKFYQACGGVVLMIASPYLSIYHYTILLFLSLCIATFAFLGVVREEKTYPEQEKQPQVA